MWLLRVGHLKPYCYDMLCMHSSIGWPAILGQICRVLQHILLDEIYNGKVDILLTTTVAHCQHFDNAPIQQISI